MCIIIHHWIYFMLYEFAKKSCKYAFEHILFIFFFINLAMLIYLVRNLQPQKHQTVFISLFPDI